MNNSPINIRRILTVIVLVMIAQTITGCGSKLTAETTGRVTSTTMDRERKTTRRKTSSGKTKKTTKVDVETGIDYEYTVDGRNLTGYSEKDGDVRRDFASGASVTVCYNPKNPEESDVYTAGTKCQ